MRFTLGATVVLMGLLGLVLALTTGEIYHNEALSNQRLALRDLVELGTTEQLGELGNRSRDLALAMQSEAGLRAAWPGGGPALATELHRQLRQYAATVKRIHVVQLTAYDSGLRPRAAASPETVLSPPHAPACAADGERGSHGEVRALCQLNRQVRNVVRVPVHLGNTDGFLEVVTDPVPSLVRIQDRLGLPVRIRNSDGNSLYTSKGWPSADAMQDALVAEHTLTGANHAPALRVAALRDIQPLRTKLHEDRLLVMTVAIAVTFLGMLLAISFLERTALQPLNTLTEHLRRVSGDRSQLDETVNVGGITEVRELADDFNHMARELSRLYDSLEHMAFTDPLTNLPNRARFRDSLEESAQRHAQAHTPFALLLMDLDRFKEVNDTYGHQAGDLLLQEVSVRLKSVLRGSDTVARLDNETILELDSKMVARLGGDEFAAILPRVGNMDAAGGIARKLLVVMQEPFAIRNHSVSIGISIGIALYPKHGQDIETLIQRADAAMYYAKNTQTGLAFPEAMQQTRLI